MSEITFLQTCLLILYLENAAKQKLPFGDIRDPLALTGDTTDPLEGDTGTFALKCTYRRLKTSKLQKGNSNFLMLERFSNDEDILKIYLRKFLSRSISIII